MYYIHNDKNKYSKEDFEQLLYDACRVEAHNNKEKLASEYLKISVSAFHPGMMLKITELCYQQMLKRIMSGEVVKVDDVDFYIKKEKENGR